MGKKISHKSVLKNGMDCAQGYIENKEQFSPDAPTDLVASTRLQSSVHNHVTWL